MISLKKKDHTHCAAEEICRPSSCSRLTNSICVSSNVSSRYEETNSLRYRAASVIAAINAFLKRSSAVTTDSTFIKSCASLIVVAFPACGELCSREEAEAEGGVCV